MGLESLHIVEPQKELEKHAQEKAIEDRISGADLEEVNGILDHINEVITNNPEILQTPEAKRKIEKVFERYNELVKKETLH